MTLMGHGQQETSRILGNMEKKPGHAARGAPNISVAAVFVGTQTYEKKLKIIVSI